MFTLLTPSALLALLGLLVPVAIHLWNRRPGREVPVGSVRWLAAGANRRLRNLKPEQLWLLLLRAALLAVLAVALAGPTWRRTRPAGRGQVLLSPEALSNPALAALRPTIDSLRRRGYALRWLAAGFPKLSEAAWREGAAGARDSARLLGKGPVAGFRWARVQQAAAAFAGQPLYVLTPATVQGFQGPHPALPANITWQVLPSLTASTWLQEANAQGDSLHLLLGRSTETQTTFRWKTTRQPRHHDELLAVAGLASLRYRLNNAGAPGGLLVPAAGSGPAVPIEAVPMRMEIYTTPAYASEARYLRAAVQAAALGLSIQPKINVTYTPPSHIPAWLFWLSDEPLPAGWRKEVRHGARIWQEASGPGTPVAARLVPEVPAEMPANIFRRGTLAAAPGSQPVWTDGQGRPVLSWQPFGAGAVYRLHTRLSPGWSDLADNPALPARLLAVLKPISPEPTAFAPTALDSATWAYDRRALAPAQLPTASTAGSPEKQTTMPSNVPALQSTDLRPWLVLAAGILFALERLLARRREVRATALSL